MRNNVTWADLVACARRVGVEVIEAPSSHRGKKGSMGSVRGVTCHHTGTPNTYKASEEYPDFNVVKEGRSDLRNSLSAYGIGRHRAIIVFSEFLSWHAGEWNWKGLTDGNGDFLGIECAGVGDYTDFQRAVYPRLVASLLLFLGEPADMAPRHLDGAQPRGRKSDAARFETAFHDGLNFYDSVRFFMANPAWININYQGDDLPSFGDRISDPAFEGTIRASEGLFAAVVTQRRVEELVTAVTALTETLRAVSAAREGVDADKLLAGVEEIVRRNRATLNVEVTPVD